MTEVFGAVLVAVFVGLVIYGCIKIIDGIVNFVVGLFVLHKQYKDTRLTNLHYFDHPDRYFDFQSNQWHFKQESA